MITRYALFEGRVHDGQFEAFRDAIIKTALPTWNAFPGAVDVRLSFAVGRDPGAPEYAMILAISYPDQATLDAALASPVRLSSRAATESVLALSFVGKIHHHFTESIGSG